MQWSCVILATGPITVGGAITGGMLLGSIIGVPIAGVMTLLSRKGSRAERFVYTLFASIVSTIAILVLLNLLD